MPYIAVGDFRLGMDRRRKRVAGTPGSLWRLKNGVINRGGEIEGIKKFVSTYTLPTGTYGMAAVGGELYVFGSTVDPGVPAGLNYQRLQHPDGTSAMTRVLDVDTSDGKLYVVASFDDDSVQHFYDGARVLDWNAGIVAAWMADTAGIAAHLCELIDASDHFTATCVGTVITVTGEDNVDYDVETVATDGGAIDDQTLVAVTTQAAAPSTPKIVEITVGGTFDPGDKFTVRLGSDATLEGFGYEGSPSPVAETVLTFQSKVYAAGGSLVNFDGINTPDLWNRDNAYISGQGFINAASQDGGSDSVTGLEIYQGSVAVFSRRTVQIWQMAADAGANSLIQSVRNTGTRSPRSTSSFGSTDVFYLSDSGVRSLRARDGTDTAYASDIGTPLDTFIREYLETLTDDEIERAVAAIEPLDDRYLLAVKARVFAFSYFPTSKISAWSYMEPGFEISDWARVDDKLYARAGDVIYLYGGSDGSTYPDADETPTEVYTPYFDGKTPATPKKWKGYDQAAEGDWVVYALPDPNDEDVMEPLGTFTDTTYADPKNRAEMDTTHMALNLTCSSAGRRVLASIALHHGGPEDAG